VALTCVVAALLIWLQRWGKLRGFLLPRRSVNDD
jgi:hypothetical protein